MHQVHSFNSQRLETKWYPLYVDHIVVTQLQRPSKLQNLGALCNHFSCSRIDPLGCPSEDPYYALHPRDSE